MTKTNPLWADPLGPYALVQMEGASYKVLRPTSLGWDIESTGTPKKKRFLSHDELHRGEADRSIVVTRPKGEDPSLQAMSLKARRDIFIKNWWLVRVVEALRNGSLASTGDVALATFFSGLLTDIKKDLEIWEKDSGYDHSAVGRKKPRKANVGSEKTVAEPVLTPRSIRGLLPKFLHRHKNPLSLRKRTENCRSGGKRVDERVLDIVREEVAKYAGEANPTVEGLRKLVAARIVLRNSTCTKELALSTPSWGTLNRVKEDIPEGRKIGARKGARAVNVALGPFGEGPTYHRVGERCEIDCWNIPVFVLLKRAGVISEVPTNIVDELVEKAKRIHVAAVGEKSTGYITGMKFGLAESAELTTAALKMSLMDKTKYSNWAGCEQRWNMFTGIEECSTDAGPGFIGDRFLSAVIPATSSHVYAASGLPHLRGLIESIFSTLHKGFIAKMVARAFENVVAKGKYEAEKRAVLQLEEFLQLLVRYVVDVYHNLPRDGGLRRSPHREFEAKASTMETKPPPTPDEIRVWFGFEARRKLGPRGVRFMHIHYDSDWLVKYRTHYGLEEVLIRVDEDDLGAISVLLDGDWLPVPARDFEFQGVCLEDWVDLLADLRMRFGPEAEIDFERYVAPALIEIERANRAAEKAMGLQDVFWSEQRFQQFEDRNQINMVNRARPEAGKPAPSFGEGTIGRRFDRPAEPKLPQPETSPSPKEAEMTPLADTPPRRRSLKYRED
ncbi:Mu transposase C-terminal domain-containing protein [Devosia sp. LjRoot16]|uniref:Mu transposase C-terminal domain-containing protein n=1 Tax=Devosia sp. LjRoot16 TaxID=3342271 RepID=UPI003ECC2018